MAEADAVPDLSKVVCMFCLNAKGLQNPKSLPCSHIYCLKCVTRYYEVNGILRCPLCRENFAETPESLPSAYQVPVVDHSILCDVCTTKGLGKKPAVTYCTECSRLFCAKHQHAHDYLLEGHDKINIDVYKRQTGKLQPRMCPDHKDFPYSMGCRICLTPMCNKCISGGGSCTDGSAHQLLTLDEMVTELTTVDQIQDKEDRLDDLFKLMSNIIADFDTETDSLLTMLHKQRDEQLEEIQLKYQNVEKDFSECRARTKSDMVEFMEENVGVKLSDLYINRMKIEVRLAHSHQVDIVDGYAKIQDQIQKLLSDAIPELDLPALKTLEVKEQRRDVEIEIVSAGSGRVSLEQGLVIIPPLEVKEEKRDVEIEFVSAGSGPVSFEQWLGIIPPLEVKEEKRDVEIESVSAGSGPDSFEQWLGIIPPLEVKEEKRDIEIEVVSAGSGYVSLEQGLVITPPPPPKSMKLVRRAEVSGYCYSVCEHKGITYVGVTGGVVRIENCELTKSLTTRGGPVEGITVYKDRLYLLVDDQGTYTVNVHQLTGERITQWSPHIDYVQYPNQLVIVEDQVVIPNRKNKQLTMYTLTGKVVKSVPCPLLTYTTTAICAADAHSVIITNYGSSQVFKVDIVTGEVLWSSTSVSHPQGVACYKEDYVLVASYSTTTTIWVLEVKTGKLLTTITDHIVRSDTDVYDLHISGNTLIVPRFGEEKVLFYQLD